MQRRGTSRPKKSIIAFWQFGSLDRDCDCSLFLLIVGLTSILITASKTIRSRRRTVTKRVGLPVKAEQHGSRRATDARNLCRKKSSNIRHSLARQSTAIGPARIEQARLYISHTVHTVPQRGVRWARQWRRCILKSKCSVWPYQKGSVRILNHFGCSRVQSVSMPCAQHRYRARAQGQWQRSRCQLTHQTRTTKSRTDPSLYFKLARCGQRV